MTMNVGRARHPRTMRPRTIADVVRGVRPFVSHVLVVDDGSSDGTADEARAAGAQVVVTHPENLGKGQSLARTGLAHHPPTATSPT